MFYVSEELITGHRARLNGRLGTILVHRRAFRRSQAGRLPG